MNESSTQQPRSRRSVNRSQLLGTLALLALVVLTLLLINNRSGPSGGADTTTTTTTATGTAAGADQGDGRVVPTRSSPRPTVAGTRRAPATGVDPDSGLPFIAAAELPRQADDTLTLIAAGGPYPFPRNDDQTYFNNNGVLPRQPSGYYREYTVITPGSKTRGARRIIAGRAGELYYTADHYDSFRRILEDR